MTQVFDKQWRTIKSLDSGGQGNVYLVHKLPKKDDTRYALKELQQHSKLPRFKQETEAVRKLDHHNIISVVDYNLSAEKPYVVMEYCPRGSLADHPEAWRDNPAKTLRLYQTIVEAVKTAHDEGIVHRDLKPANILLRDMSTPVVSDFGICYFEDGDRQTITETNEVVGARFYTAPELLTGGVDEVDPASDVYSLGKLLYWMLSGGQHLPRSNHRDPNFNLADRTGDRELGIVHDLLDSMITEDPSERHHDLGEVLGEVDAVLGVLTGKYRPIGMEHSPRCTYCGRGRYEVVVHPWQGGKPDEQKWGYKKVNEAEPLILACQKCGHIQYFRTEVAEENWKKGQR